MNDANHDVIMKHEEKVMNDKNHDVMVKRAAGT